MLFIGVCIAVMLSVTKLMRWGEQEKYVWTVESLERVIATESWGFDQSGKEWIETSHIYQATCSNGKKELYLTLTPEHTGKYSGKLPLSAGDTFEFAATDTATDPDLITLPDGTTLIKTNDQ